MGTFNVTIEVAAGADGPFESMEAMVDTGATFTVAPASILHRLGVEPTRRIRFALADGSRMERDAGWRSDPCRWDRIALARRLR